MIRLLLLLALVGTAAAVAPSAASAPASMALRATQAGVVVGQQLVAPYDGPEAKRLLLAAGAVPGKTKLTVSFEHGSTPLQCIDVIAVLLDAGFSVSSPAIAKNIEIVHLPPDYQPGARPRFMVGDVPANDPTSATALLFLAGAVPRISQLQITAYKHSNPAPNDLIALLTKQGWIRP
jgi:hypothetical protein